MSDHDQRTGEVIDGEYAEQSRQIVRGGNGGGGGGEVDLLAIIEKRNKLIERILEYAIKATHAGQWNDLGGKPWPTGPACEVMARRCGVKIENVRRTKRMSSDDKGDFYIYEVDAVAKLPGAYDSIEAFGTCSSRDTFLGTETSKGRELSEIDEGSIMKAAYTNMEVNAITRLLGVRNMSWERLTSLGISRESMAKVEYAKGSKGGGQGGAPTGLVIGFGSGAGKTPDQLDDKNLDWYRKAYGENVANPEKAKYKDRNEQLLKAIEAEIASRAAKKTGAAQAPATNGNQPANTGQLAPWERIKQLFASAGHKEGYPALAKQITGKASSSELNEDDVARVQQWASDQKSQAAGANDIPF